MYGIEHKYISVLPHIKNVNYDILTIKVYQNSLLQLITISK
jgi:hypothetical protein